MSPYPIGIDAPAIWVHMASAEHEPITGVWGLCPSGVQSVRVQSPLMLNIFLCCDMLPPWLRAANSAVHFRILIAKWRWRGGVGKFCRFCPKIVCHNKKHLKNVGPIRHCEPPHAHSPDVTTDAACASMSTTTPTPTTTTTTRDRGDRYGPMEWAQ